MVMVVVIYSAHVRWYNSSVAPAPACSGRSRSRRRRASMFGGVNLFSSPRAPTLLVARAPLAAHAPWEVPRTGDYGMVF